MSNSTVSGTLTLNDVVSSMMNDEMQRKTIGDGISSSTALSVESRGRQNNKQNNRGRSPTSGRSKSRGKLKSKRRTIVCWNCNKEGHKKNDCTKPKKKKGVGGRQGDDKGQTCESDMRILHLKNALPGMKNVQLDFCEGCVYGKQKRVNFQRDGKEKKIERLELVHTDVCGPITVKSLEGNKVKCLKSDNGGEYRDGGFQEYCSNNVLGSSCGYCLYLINKSLASALNGGIPEEEWSGKPINYSFLRVFGCFAYAHIDKEERKKLDSKSQKCVFIGYGGDEYGYYLWDYEHNKIIKSKDIIFDKSRLYKHWLQEHGIEKENKEYMELDEPEDGQVPRTENSEVLDETTDTQIRAGDQQQNS
ncbi:hypothetical protein RJ639_020970 [Escallonia herrerae]|uniref:CCHC-type domain-containing protein n=1 Tax=Escallonia herrerae TaxID=1293975 RepID=A0AA89AEM8_9ASTE|nr:hypothetical protein RJ639_020970 [Escallonia herrerae]